MTVVSPHRQPDKPGQQGTLFSGSLYILYVRMHTMSTDSAPLLGNRIKGRSMSCAAQLCESPNLRDYTHSTRFQLVLISPLLTTACLRPTPRLLCHPCLLLPTRRPPSTVLYHLLRRSSSPTSSSSQTFSLTVPSLPNITLTETPSWPSLSTGCFLVVLT